MNRLACSSGKRQFLSSLSSSAFIKQQCTVTFSNFLRKNFSSSASSRLFNNDNNFKPAQHSNVVDDEDLVATTVKVDVSNLIQKTYSTNDNIEGKEAETPLIKFIKDKIKVRYTKFF